MYQGQTLKLTRHDGGIVELCFDRAQESINKFDTKTLGELREAAALLGAAEGLRGLLVTSAKDAFIVGADITEFGALFELPEEKIVEWVLEANAIFSAVEDLPFPSVVAINGFALGGGFEMALSLDYRVIATTGQVGFPEVKLGIIPGFGGTVRMARLTGADNAIEWIASGSQNKADAALKVHAVDGVVPPEKLREGALKVLQQAIDGKLDWQARRAQKKGPLKLDMIDQMMVFETSKAYVAQKAGPNVPGPLEAVKVIQKAAGKSRDAAIKIEAAAFAKLARTPVANALTGVFLSDQFLKRKAKQAQKIARPVKHAAVLGAGIMGGGIAYTSAVKGVPVVMKDIADQALDLGMSEANKLLAKQIERGKLTPEKAGKVLSSIRPVLSYEEIKGVDLVVEAVVENPKVKKLVLAEVEATVAPGTIIASNTSSISIDDLSTALKAPEHFLGMHFFNPVHRMPLVEVIYGAQTSKEAIATTVAYASAMGKTPIVVKNCPGFLVNRILFPYFYGFLGTVRDGADFARIDKVMERFGWPMGPAYLLDVVGIDTGHHVAEVLAAGYPDRMGPMAVQSALDVMYGTQRFGQKNGLGFYRYETDPKGKPKKSVDPESYALIQSVQPHGTVEMSDEEIIDRHMLPMIIETVRCLDDGIVESPQEADLGLIYGLGFPPHLGGALKYADRIGMENLLAKCSRYASLGKLYEPTASMQAMAASGKTFYSK